MEYDTVDVGASVAAVHARDRPHWTSRCTADRYKPFSCTPFFGERTRVEDVLVAQVDGIVSGYAKLRQAIPFSSH